VNLGPTCQSDCSNTFALQNGGCTDLGLEMTSCLTSKVPSASFKECWLRFYDVSQQCYREVGAYQQCVVDSGGAPLPVTALCSQLSTVWPADASSGTAPGCIEDRKCLTGLVYKVRCSETGENQSSCTCSLKERPLNDFVWDGPISQACKEALPGCLTLASSMFNP
jgi:hypothetical protein